MNIHEYQGKQLLKKFGIKVPEGRVAFTPQEAEKEAQILQSETGSKIIVVKAQIHAGGRGKAGGVKLCKTPHEAKEIAQEMLGKILVTHQTGPEGREVKRLYIESGTDIKKEYYLGIVVDRETSRVTFMVSTEGGVDIEEVAAHHPEKIQMVSIDPASGFQDFHARKLGFGLGFEGAQLKEFVKLAAKFYRAFVETDASQLEINPLVVTGTGEIIPLDAKFNFDSNALYRHKDIEDMRDENEEDPMELRASKASLSYVKMDGSIGCMVNGAGLAMATMDIIKLYGQSPANFLDVGGGATKERVIEAFRIILSDPNVKAILVNIFGGIMRCDIIAEGVIAAAKEVGLNVPLVVRLEGTNVDLGKEILNKSGLAITSADNLADAAQKVVNAVAKEAA
ncbi:MAG: ADP-forming succinate--CoA ligase subunit beta [Alphaproteobacteria bacterium]|nr:ADP-forming succinate--CoA ligase subunit beta [Alphaproteobacteria bacterium]